MAANDSSSRDLDKRTKELAGREIGKGQGLVEQQLAQNQLQAIQSERRNNLMTERAIEQQVQGNNQILAQAGQMVAASQPQQEPQMTLNPQTQGILSKYQGAPKVQRTQGHDVKVTPNHITINNNYKTETTNNVNAGGGPVQGRPVVIKSNPQGGTDGGQAKFRTWLGNIFDQQKQESARREKEFDRREWSLTKSANKMLRRIESAGKDIVDNMNPRVIGTTIRSQFQALLFLFGVRFLAKHWTKVLDIFVGISNKIKGALDYFGISEDGKRLAASGKGLKGDLISFFGGNPNRDKSLLNVFKRLGSELMDYLKEKFDNSMEERGAAIKAIKFPKLDFSDMAGALSGISGYLADILTAMVDPKTGIRNAITHNINNAGKASSMNAARRDGDFEHTSISKNTDMGEYSITGTVNGKRKYSLLSSALDSSGDLKDNIAGEVSQGRDILGTINDARSTGRLDTSRLAAGFSRMQKNANETGGVVVDEEFIRRLYGGDAARLLNSHQISPVKYKYVRVKKTDDDFAAQNARGFKQGVTTSIVNESMVDMVPGSDSFTGDMAKILMNSQLTSINGVNTSNDEASASFLTGGIFHRGYLGAMTAGIANKINRWNANDYTLKLVPANDPRPAVKLNGQKQFFTFYNLTPQAVRALSMRYTKQKSFDLSNINQYKALERTLQSNGGGAAAVSARFKDSGIEGPQRDYDISEYEQISKNFDNMQAMHRAEEEATMPTWNKMGNNFLQLGNKAIGAVNSGLSWAYNMYKDATNAKDATFSYDYAPTRPNTNTGPFDVQSAINTLRSNAHGNSTGKCAMYVTAAIGSGLHMNRRPMMGDAHEISGKLGQYGFAPVSWEKYYPQAGDVYVCPALTGHRVGHVAMYDGTHWISDFHQRDIWGGREMRIQKKGVIFRHISLFGKGDTNYDQALNISNNTTQEGNYSSGAYSSSGSSYYGGSFSIGGGNSYNGPSGGYSYSGGGSGPSYGGNNGASFSATANFNYSIPTSLKGGKGEFWARHKAEWARVLKAHGYNDADTDRLSGFFTAQDGFESAGGKSAAAIKRNNFGGMMSKDGKRTLSYSSVEEYMNDKLNMMRLKFKDSLSAKSLDDYVLSLGRTNKNTNNYIYYEEDPGKYLRGTASYYAGQYGGSGQSSYNPLNNVYDKGSNDDSGADSDSAPQIDFRFGAKSDSQMRRLNGLDALNLESVNLYKKFPEIKTSYPSFSDFRKYWTGLKINERRKLMEGLTAYHNHKDAIKANKETSRLGAIEFAENWAKTKNGWSYINQWEKNNQYNKRAGFGNTFVKGNREWMQDQAPKGIFREGLIYGNKGAVSYFTDKQVSDTVYKDILNADTSKIINYNDKLGAGVLFGGSYINMDKQLKEIEKQIPRTFEKDKKTELKSKRDRLLARMKYFEDSARGFIKEANGKDKKFKQHSYSKWKEAANIGLGIEDIVDKKKEVDIKYNLLLNDVANQDPKIQAKLVEQYFSEVGNLENQRLRLNDRLNKLKLHADKQEAEFIKQTEQHAKLMSTSTEQLKEGFKKYFNNTKSYIESIRDMIKEYGKEVLAVLSEEIGSPKTLTEDDFKTGKDFEAYVKKQKEVHDRSPLASYSPDDVVSAHRALINKGYIKDDAGMKNSIQYTTVGKNYNLLKPAPSKINIGTINLKTVSSDHTKGFGAGSIRGGKSNAPYRAGYATGGYTGDGYTTDVAGLVHAGEWVAPQWMVRSGKFKPVIKALEKERLVNRGGSVAAWKKESKAEKEAENMINNQGESGLVVDPINAQGQAETNALLRQIASNTAGSSKHSHPDRPMKVIKRATV